MAAGGVGDVATLSGEEAPMDEQDRVTLARVQRMLGWLVDGRADANFAAAELATLAAFDALVGRLAPEEAATERSASRDEEG